MFFSVLKIKVGESVKKWREVVEISFSLSTFDPVLPYLRIGQTNRNYGYIFRYIRMQNGRKGQGCPSSAPEGSSA